MSCANCSCNHYPRLGNAAIDIQHTYDLMVIGESPTVAETRQNIMMGGPGGQVLKDTLKKVGMPYSSDLVYYTDAIKCSVPKKKGQKFPKDAPGCCRDYLLWEYREVKPKLILVCGAVALQTLTGNDKLKVTEEYGRIKEYDFLPGVKVIPVMNPGVLLHKPGDYKPFLSMFQLAATVFNDGESTDPGETKWIVCDTEDKCRDLWKLMMSQYKAGTFECASYDIETTGLDYRIVDFLVLGICFKKNLSYVIPREMRHVVHNFIAGIPWKCVWQNGKYDKKVMWRRQLGNVQIDEDTEYQHYTLDETSAHDLGYLTKTFLNAKAYKYKMNQNWKVVTLENFETYREAIYERVAVDCDYTLQLKQVLQKKLEEPGNEKLMNLYKTLLIPAANYLSRVEQNGMLIDPEYLNVLDKKYTILLEQLLVEIQECAEPFWNREMYMEQMGAKSASDIFKPSSPKQMSWMVFRRLKLRPRIKKGESTNKEILGSIENPPPLIKKVLEYRTVQKEHSTYVLGLLNARDEDGRVRTTFNLHITATGRLSSKEPNVQNQPSAHGVGNIRKAFISKPGFILAEIDYSGAELRWLAFMSKCPVLSEVFIQGRNLHKETATTLFGPHYTPQQKMRAKAVNFGIPYGREAHSIAEEFNISDAEAQDMLDAWLDKYHGARDYLKWCADQVALGKYLETPFGRRRRFGLVSPQSLHGLQNEAKNFPIQSASSDTLLWSCMQMEDKLRDDYQTNMLDLIHDSTVLEVPADPRIIQAVGTYANHIMVETPKKLFDCPIPFTTDFEIGVNWGDMGGVEFDYNDPNPTSGEVMHIENKDGSITDMTFADWYKQVTQPQILIA